MEDVDEKVKDRILPSDVFQGYSWFTYVPTVKQIGALGNQFQGIVKKLHSLYPKEQIEITMKYFPEGTHLVLESKQDGKSIYAIGYKYSSRKVLCIITLEGCGSTFMGKPYKVRWTDCHGNVHYHSVPRSELISTFFEQSNDVDTHNHVR